MRCFVVSSDTINGRLDPQYLIALAELRRSRSKYPSVPLADLLVEKPQYGANESAVDGNPKTDTRYIRITDIDEFGNLTNDWKTAKTTDERYLLREGDLLFARSGATVGKTFIYRKSHPKAIFAGYLIRFRIDHTKADPRFVFHYSQLTPYAVWVKATQRPSGQPNINSKEFSALRIPLPPVSVQRQIVEIMETAYARKRQHEEEAKKLAHSVQQVVLKLLGIKPLEYKPKRCYTVQSTEVAGWRIDPTAYHPNRLSALERIRSSGLNTCPLKELVEFKRDMVTAKTSSFPYVGLENIESNTGAFVASKDEKVTFDNALRFSTGDILFPKLRPYLNKVHLAEFEGVCSTEFHILRTRSCNANFLLLFLNSPLVLNQTAYLMTGNTLPRLQTEDVENLLIAIPSEKVQDAILREASERTSKARKFGNEAVQLIKEAKQQVEKLIFSG